MNHAFSHSRRPRLATALRNGVSALCITAIAACATVEQAQRELVTTWDNLFANFDDPALDPVCHTERGELVDSATLFDEETLLIIGVGVAAGIIVGISTESVGKGIAATALILAGAYIRELVKDGRSSREVTQTFASDISKANDSIDEVIVAFKGLDRCRSAEAARVKQDYRAGRITFAAAQAQMATVKFKRTEDVKKFRELADSISDTTEGYALAFNEIAADNNTKGFEVQENRKIVRTKRVPEKSATEEGSLAGAGRKNVNALQRDCLTNIRKRDECFDIAEAAEAESDDFEIEEEI